MCPTMQVVATVIYPHDEPPAPLPRAVEAMLAQHFSSVTAAKKAIRRREILVAGKVCNTSRYALQLPYVLAVMVSSQWQNMTDHLVTTVAKSSVTPHVHSFLRFSIHTSIHPFHSLHHSFIHQTMDPLIRLFIHSFIHSLIQSFIHSFIHSFSHSFIHSFIQHVFSPSVRSWVAPCSPHVPVSLVRVHVYNVTVNCLVQAIVIYMMGCSILDTLTVSASVLQGCTARGALGMDAEGARG